MIHVIFNDSSSDIPTANQAYEPPLGQQYFSHEGNCDTHYRRLKAPLMALLPADIDNVGGV